jgi:cytosine/adenosine deaminase-related metal-dependent hydrolase
MGAASLCFRFLPACVRALRWPVSHFNTMLLSACAAGLAGSKVAASTNNPAVSAAMLQHQLSWEDALYLATAGGAAALGLDNVVGHFRAGMQFDALLVDCGLEEVFDLLSDSRDPLVLLESFINNGDDRNIVAVWVHGRLCCQSNTGVIGCS